MMDFFAECLKNQDLLLKGELLLRLLLAVLCGAVIGYERTNRGKGAGIRTHTIVAIASCLMMIISQYGFGDFFENFSNPNVEMRLDPSRVAAQIVSGIGFLGAGMIFIQKNVVMGLTTAAGIWAVAGIGMAIGCGMYFISIASCAIIMIVQILMHKNAKFLHTHTEEEVVFAIEDRQENLDLLIQELNERNLKVVEMSCSKKEDDILQVKIVFHAENEVDKGELISILYRQQGIKKVKI